MARYVTPASLRELLPGDWIEEYLKTDPIIDGAGRIVGYQPATDAQLESFIASAEDEADSYVGVAYSLPLPSAPRMLTQVVADICRYRISADNPTEAIRTRYQDALSYLGKLARGTASLGLSAADAQPAPTVKVASRKKPLRLTRDRLSSWGL